MKENIEKIFVPFGTNISQIYKSKLPFIENTENDTPTLLAVCMVNLDLLLQNLDQSYDAQCHTSQYLTSLKTNNLFEIDTTVNTVNLITDNIPNILSEGDLLNLCTNLIIHTQLSVFPSLLEKKVITYSRYFFILHDGSADFLEYIFDHNKKTTDNEDIITGFIFHDGNNTLAFFEGESNGYISNILHFMKILKAKTEKIFFNTNLLFEERLYNKFISYNGIYKIVLNEPLKDILLKQLIFVRYNLPILCLQVIHTV